MRSAAWLIIILAVLAVLYGALVVLLGFEGTIALAIQFGRVSIALAVLVVYAPVMLTIFRTWPPAPRDYLLAGTFMLWLSAVCFALLNALGAQFGIDRSVLTSPIAGFFSLLLVVGGVFHMLVPEVSGDRRRIVGLIIGGIVGAIVVAAPFFLAR